MRRYAQFLNEVFREVNIFQNDIPLFLNRFVSPMSTMGPNFYKYYLLDTVEVAGQKCVDFWVSLRRSRRRSALRDIFLSRWILLISCRRLSWMSRRRSTWILSVEWRSSRLSNRAPDGTRIITKDDINVDFKLTEKSKGMYARRLNIYSNHIWGTRWS